MLAAQLTYAQAASSTSREAKAQDDNYEIWLDRAVEAFAGENFAQAYDAFEHAFALRPNARVERGLGIAALRLARYTEADLALRSSLTDIRQPLTTEQSDEVTKLIAWMQANLGTLLLQWPSDKPADCELQVDTRVVPSTAKLSLDPGRHKLVVRAPGYETQEHAVEIVAGAEERLALTFTRSSAQAQATPAASGSSALTRAGAADSVSPRASARAAEGMRAVSAVPPAAGSYVLQTGAQRDASPEGGTSVFERWWFWTIVGAVAAGGVTAALVLTAPPKSHGYETNSIGGPIFMPLRLSP